jgi:hypothetical protein
MIFFSIHLNIYIQINIFKVIKFLSKSIIIFLIHDYIIDKINISIQNKYDIYPKYMIKSK